MTPLQSTVMEATISIPTGKKLKSVVTGKPAPTSGGNLWIEIRISGDTAEFECRDKEHAGKHKNRKVTFRSNQDCVLGFFNMAVFGVDAVRLKAGKKQELMIEDKADQIETEYAAYMPATKTGLSVPEAAMTVMPNERSLNDPKIVVP